MIIVKTKQQYGISLVGLMIGMLLSVLTLLAAMTMYQGLVDTAIETKVDAKHDAEIASAMLTMQLELHNAGYFIDDADSAQLFKDPDANVEAIYWRYNQVPSTDANYDNSYICNRLIFENDRRLIFNTSRNPECKAVSDLDNESTMFWEESHTLTDFFAVTAVEFRVDDNVACWPFGRDVGANNHRQVSIIIQSAASRATGGTEVEAADTITASTYAFCTPNMPSQI